MSRRRAGPGIPGASPTIDYVSCVQRPEDPIEAFLDTWHSAASTSVGLFWTAFWAFGLGYLISAMIQVFVTRERMQAAMGEAGPRSVALGTVFGFLSSSCSFSALSSTRALFARGAGLVPSLAFLLASTNLVVELGIVIAMFLGWQFVVGEYVGGVLLIGLTWVIVRLTLPAGLEEAARARAEEAGHAMGGEEPEHPWDLIRSRQGWLRVARAYGGEWEMVWKDVAIGFAVAGVIAAFVPAAFFETLFPGGDDPSVLALAAQALVGPLAAFVTFIGSMGNVPLAAVLFANGVSFAGVMAFLFSDLVVLPVLRIQARYYGWKPALYILGVFLVALVSAALLLHAGFGALGLLPSADAVGSITERSYFHVDYTLFLNVLFGGISLGFAVWATWISPRDGGMDMDHGASERVLTWLAIGAFAWLGIGLLLGLR